MPHSRIYILLASRQSPYFDQKIELLEARPPSIEGRGQNYGNTENDDDTVSSETFHGLPPMTSGIGHLSLDVSRVCTCISRYLDSVQKDSIERFEKSLRVLQAPKEMVLGDLLLETAFISDADGAVIEFIRFINHQTEDDEVQAVV